MPVKQSSARLFIGMIVAIYALAYLFRWFYLSYYLSNATVLTDVNPDWNLITVDAFNQAFAICSLIFGIFFLLSRNFAGEPVRNDIQYRYFPVGLGGTVFFVTIVIITLLVRRTYGSVLGEAPADVPFGLGTPIYRAQADVIPGIMLLMAEAAWMAAARGRYFLWIFCLAGFNIAMAILTTSKAGLIYFAVQFLMLMFLTGQNIFARPWRLLLLAAGSIAIFVISAQLRSQALLGTDALILYSIKQGDVIGTVLEVGGLIINRLPGTEGLALYCGYECVNLPQFQMPDFTGEAGRVFTQDVINVRGDFDYRSPGFIGGSIIIGGLWGGALLAIAFLQTALVGFRIADRNGLSAATRITLCFGLFKFILEGTWAWQDLVSITIAAIVVETLARTLVSVRIKDQMPALPARALSR